MLLSDVSVKRPVFATVISLLLIAFGIISFERLSLREYPDIDPPVVTVEVEYPGAPANVVETRITEVVEEQISGIGGIESISSESRDGLSRVTIEFSVNRDVDDAANDVRDRISGVTDNLPDEARPPEVQKADSNDDVIIWQNFTSDRHTVPELTDYAERYLVDQYSALNGVARVIVGGGLNYAMRIWLDRQELAARGLSVSQIEAALRAENIEVPAGQLESDQQMFTARVERYFRSPESFKSLVIARGEDGSLVRLSDVARVELGLEDDRSFFRGNGSPMVGIGVTRQSTANTLEVTDNVVALGDKLNDVLPEGMSIQQSYNAAVFIKASIKEVYLTLAIAIACVIFIIYLFLGNVRAMLIPAITVPISLLASFIVMYAAGLSINILTLLALVLAIGLVVDDAIVMLENIVRRINDYGETPLTAAYRGAKQVGFAVIATTLVLIAVFVPITLVEGNIGRLFTEFAVTIIAAVSFSSIIALTLCPMLASKVLKSRDSDGESVNLLTQRFSIILDKCHQFYLSLLEKCLNRPIWVIVVFLGIIGSAVLMYPKIDQEFIPKEDRGTFFVIVRGPEGATYDYMKGYMDQVEQLMMKYADSGEFKRMLVRVPGVPGNIQAYNTGIVIVVMDDWANRRPANEILREVAIELSQFPGIRAFPIMRQGLGGGARKPVQFVIGGSSYEELADWRDTLLTAVREDNPGLNGLDSDYKENRPQIDFRVLYDRAADLGVTVNDIGRTLETMMGGRRVTTYMDKGQEYNVIVEGERESQRSFADINNIYVPSQSTGELIPLSNLVEISEYGAANTLSRFNRVRAITVEASLAEDYRLSDALSFLNKKVDELLPDDAIVDYKGQSREFINAGGTIVFAFILGLIIVFLVLSAQFESFVHPLVILLTVPVAVAGALFALLTTGNSLNIYSEIALIMLIGLAAKNGILIVEFANQLRDEGREFRDAIMTSAKVRFRPIVMTGLTTIAGSIPLVLASGAGAETRSVIGVVILAGVFAATLFTLFLVPIAYGLIAKNTGSPNDVSRELEKQSAGSPENF